MEEEKIKGMFEELDALIQQMPGGCAIVQGGEQWQIIAANDEFFMPSGRTREEINSMQNDFRDIIYKMDIPKLRRKAEVAESSGKVQECEVRIYDGTGKVRWYSIKIRFLKNQNDNSYYLVSGWDINEKKRVEEYVTVQKSRQDEMAKRLRLDALTGVLNKSVAREVIEEVLKNESLGEHAFLLIDIDDFKNINDTFGHLFGDSVLVNVAEKISALFRSSDVVGRIGGDEFIVFMKNAGQKQAREKAQSICEAVRQKYNGMEEQVEITCSVGVSLYQMGKGDYNTLFSQADIAMYKAKKAGKNQCYIVESLELKWKSRQERSVVPRNSQYKAGKEQDFDFLTKAFLLLSHAKDVNNSLNLLIERIGREYGLGAVAVLESDEGKTEFSRTNAWEIKQGILPRQQLSKDRPKWKKIREKMDEDEMVCINDCQHGSELNEDAQEIFRENGIYAMMTGGFSYFDSGKGYVLFCDMEKSREWNKFEKEMFRELVHLLSVFVAIRRQQEEEQQTIKKLKKRDALTGLYNEEAFKEIVHESMENWNPDLRYAVVYTDINEFSYINDNYGQKVGNEMLKGITALIMENQNSIACRLYSDLFICFVWGKDKDSILQNVVKTNMNFSEQQKGKYSLENIKLSTGIYFMEDSAEELDIAIENANLARKSIKGNGSVFCRVYEKKMREQREHEKKIIEEFKIALGEGNFKVYIQPQIQLDKREFIGGEALVRWERTPGKIASPDSFIPALEKSGDIINLDFYVLEQVLKAMQQWQEEGKELPVISVNFSRRHFEEAGVHNKLIEKAKRYEIPTDCIEIEITESLFTIGVDIVKMEVRMLRKAGFKVAIDDFGTGYSSLSMLMDTPTDIVKIDKSFLNKASDSKGRKFIENMGRLIHSAEEKVIVEGIETEEQYEFLKKSGFEYGQGFLFERPIPLPVFAEKYIK